MKAVHFAPFRGSVANLIKRRVPSVSTIHKSRWTSRDIRSHNEWGLGKSRSYPPSRNHEKFRHNQVPMPTTWYDAPGHETLIPIEARPENRPSWAPRICSPFNLLSDKRSNFLPLFKPYGEPKHGGDPGGMNRAVSLGLEDNNIRGTWFSDSMTGGAHNPFETSSHNYTPLKPKLLPAAPVDVSIKIQSTSPFSAEKHCTDFVDFCRNIVGDAILERMIELRPVLERIMDGKPPPIPGDILADGRTLSDAAGRSVRSVVQERIARYAWELSRALEDIDALHYYRLDSTYFQDSALRMRRPTHWVYWYTQPFGFWRHYREIRFTIPFVDGDLHRRLEQIATWRNLDMTAFVHIKVQHNVPVELHTEESYARVERLTKAARAKADELAAKADPADRPLHLNAMREGDVFPERAFEWPTKSAFADVKAFLGHPIDRSVREGTLRRPPLRAYGGGASPSAAIRHFRFHFNPTTMKQTRVSRMGWGGKTSGANTRRTWLRDIKFEQRGKNIE